MADEYIRLDTTIIAIDRLINEAATGTMARTLFKAKDAIYSQQRYVIDVQPVKHGKWLDCVYDDMLEYWSATCSCCGNISTDPFCIIGSHKNCEHCGADMRDKKENENG